jgi:hypothetical protein
LIDPGIIDLVPFSASELQYSICVLRSMNWHKLDSSHHKLQQKGPDCMIC